MTLSLSAAFVIALALAFARCVAWVALCPPFANASIPVVTRILFAASIAVFTASSLQHFPLPTSDAMVITELVVQVIVGGVLGYVVSLFVIAIVGAGSLIDLFSGVNLPAAIDPLSLQQSSLFGQFYNMIMTALLFTTGSIFVIVDGFVRSFKAVGTTFPPTTLANVANVITGDVVTFFEAAFEIAAPVIAILFATQILLALLAKAAPQINVFVFGMPLQILVAIFSVGVAILAMPGDLTNLVARAFTQLFGGG